MKHPFIRRLSVTAAAVVTLVLAGCSSDEGSDTENTAEGTATSVMTTTSASETSTMESEPAGMLVGAGCADYAEANPEGPGSVEAMAMEPVATAASNNPALSTLVKAVGEAGLGDTLSLRPDPSAMIGSGRRPLFSGSQNARNTSAAVQWATRRPSTVLSLAVNFGGDASASETLASSSAVTSQ